MEPCFPFCPHNKSITVLLVLISYLCEIVNGINHQTSPGYCYVTGYVALGLAYHSYVPRWMQHNTVRLKKSTCSMRRGPLSRNSPPLCHRNALPRQIDRSALTQSLATRFPPNTLISKRSYHPAAREKSLIFLLWQSRDVRTFIRTWLSTKGSV